MSSDTPWSARDTPSYSAYLIRLWKDGGPAEWRASAQSVQTGIIVRFATLDDLFTFLLAQTIGPESDDNIPVE